jgi:hypothetical protein
MSLTRSAPLKVVSLELTNFPELARFYFQEVVMRMRTLIQSIIQLGSAGRVHRPVNPGFAARLCKLCAQLAQSQYHYRAYDSIPCRTMSSSRGLSTCS